MNLPFSSFVHSENKKILHKNMSSFFMVQYSMMILIIPSIKYHPQEYGLKSNLQRHGATPCTDTSY